MNIKDFSPLKGNLVYYYLNSPSFPGTELFFSDSNPNLYIMLLRDDLVHYDISFYKKIDGIYNGIDYDYRIDLANYIIIKHTDVKGNTFVDDIGIWTGSIEELGSDVSKICPFFTEMSDPICINYLLINNSDFFDNYVNLGYIEVLSNNDYIINNINFNNAINNVQYTYNFNFLDYSKYGQFVFDGYSIPSKIYAGAYVPILLDRNTTINSVACYVENILNFGYISNHSGSTLRTYYFFIPLNITKIIFQINGDTFDVNVERMRICDQYLYFGTENPIDSIYFTGKKEKVNQNKKRNIEFGKNTKVVSMKNSHKLIQNTGFNVTEEEIFSLAKTPYLLEMYSNSTFTNNFINTGSTMTINEYVIDELDFSGYNTKSLSNRNIALNLTKKTINVKYTGFDTGFYS